jgi:hypothetical protein
MDMDILLRSFSAAEAPALVQFSTSVFDICRGFTVEEDEARRLMRDGQVDSFGVGSGRSGARNSRQKLGKDRTRRNTRAAAITAERMQSHATSNPRYSPGALSRSCWMPR